MSQPSSPSRRFRTAAPHYLKGRPAYPERLIRRVAELTRLERHHAVLDLGCGPGQLALAFAPHAATVLGVDPEPEMLRIARLREAPNLRWMQASSRDLNPAWGHFHLVTMGRSFHWMEREETLRRLDAQVAPEGAIALFSDTHPELPENDWWPGYRALLSRFAPGREETRRRRDRSVHGHVPALLASAFNTLEIISVLERKPLTAETLVDRAFSMSSTSEESLGERAIALAREIRGLGAGLLARGKLVEIVEMQALIARR